MTDDDKLIEAVASMTERMLMVLPPQSERSKAAALRLTGMYADTPGTGPAGETCRSCARLYRKQLARAYLKCGLMQTAWTGGGKTDVKATAPACSKWEAK